MREVDLRGLQGRDAINRAWKIYQLREIAKYNSTSESMQRTRERFNRAIAQTNSREIR